MVQRVVPMIHVPDVRATLEWYKSIGFTVTFAHDVDGVMAGAALSFGSTEIMLNEGGISSPGHRREVDLYVYTDDVDELYQRLKDRVEVLEGLHGTPYGMREFIIRDLNRFWITFGQPAQA
jgi:glyoxalase/bleomycin resistance protein/dioxygenase superfamily protein